MSYTVQSVEQIRKSLDEEFQVIEPELRELAEYFAPRSQRFIASDINKARVKATKIKDGIVKKVVRVFVSGMMNGVTNQATNWFSAKVTGKNLYNGAGLNYSSVMYCNQLTELFSDILNKSNFYQTMPMVLKQLAVFKMAILCPEYNYDNVVHFKTLPIGTYRYQKDRFGELDTVIRIFSASAKNLIDEFGEDHVSENVKVAIKNKNYSQVFQVVHYVAPNKDFLPDSPFAKDKAFVSLYYELDTHKGKFLKKSGYDKLPYILFETECNGEETYPSDGPSTDALADVKQIMEMVIDETKMIKKLASPTYKGPASLKETLTSDKAGAFIADDNQTGRGLTPVYEVNPKALSVHDIIELKKRDVESCFFNDVFSVILQTAGHSRTAFEVDEIKEEKLAMLCQILTQYISSLRKLFDWLYEEALRLGIIPQAPEELIGQELEIEFETMLTKAQKVSKVAGIERLITFISNLGAQFQSAEAIKKLDILSSIDEYTRLSGVVPTIIRDTKEVQAEVQAEREQAQQQAQQQQQMEMLARGSEAIKNIGGADAFGPELMQRLGG